MIRLHHTCGATIDYSKADNGLSYVAEFWDVEGGRITSCPSCDTPLYAELVDGRLTNEAPEQTP